MRTGMTTSTLTRVSVSHQKESRSRTRCPYCDAVIKISKPREGHLITCPGCGVELEILKTDPLEVDFTFTEDWQDE